MKYWTRSVDDWQISADDLSVFRKKDLYCVTMGSEIFAMFKDVNEAVAYMEMKQNEANRSTG